MNTKVNLRKIRIAVYVDGFNLYFGLKEKGWQKYYWLNIWELGKHLAKDCNLVSVKYFTSDVRSPKDKVSRQQAYLAALEYQAPQIEIIKGKYLATKRTCQKCLHEHTQNQEKMTDVNIATHVLNDAWKDVYDVAIIVSGDSDLVPPIRIVKAEFPQKHVRVAFPPKRSSEHLKQTTTTFYINEGAFKASQMSAEVIKPDGSKLSRPSTWV